MGSENRRRPSNLNEAYPVLDGGDSRSHRHPQVGFVSGRKLKIQNKKKGEL